MRYPGDFFGAELGLKFLGLNLGWAPKGSAARRLKDAKPMDLGSNASIWVADTVLRGFVFLGFQSFEYISSMFTIGDSVYGSVFFSLTGLHGFHVFIGAIFLLVCAIMMWSQRVEIHDDEVIDRTFSFNWWSHRVAFDGAAWYWHFVDIVWLFVFLIVYWWG